MRRSGSSRCPKPAAPLVRREVTRLTGLSSDIVEADLAIGRDVDLAVSLGDSRHVAAEGISPAFRRLVASVPVAEAVARAVAVPGPQGFAILLIASNAFRAIPSSGCTSHWDMTSIFSVVSSAGIASRLVDFR